MKHFLAPPFTALVLFAASACLSTDRAYPVTLQIQTIDEHAAAPTTFVASAALAGRRSLSALVGAAAVARASAQLAPGSLGLFLSVAF